MAHLAKFQIEALVPEQTEEQLVERVTKSLPETFRVLSVTVETSAPEFGAESRTAQQPSAPKKQVKSEAKANQEQKSQQPQQQE